MGRVGGYAGRDPRDGAELEGEPHAGVHVLEMQVSVPFASAGHAFVHPPQLPLSSVKLTHAPEHES